MDTNLEVVAPGDAHVLAFEHVQPEEGGETADGGDLRAEVTADDVGVDHRLANQSVRAQGFSNRQHRARDARPWRSHCTRFIHR